MGELIPVSPQGLREFVVPRGRQTSKQIPTVCQRLAPCPAWGREELRGSLPEGGGSEKNFYLKSLPEDMFIDFKERRRGKERERQTDRHRLVASQMHPDWGLNLQPWYVP